MHAAIDTYNSKVRRGHACDGSTGAGTAQLHKRFSMDYDYLQTASGVQIINYGAKAGASMGKPLTKIKLQKNMRIMDSRLLQACNPYIMVWG